MRADGFEDLEVFKRAYRISLEVHQVTFDNFPKSSNMRLRTSYGGPAKAFAPILLRALANKVNQRCEFKRYLLMSMGSADEMRVWSRYCLDLEYIDEEQWKHWREEYRANREDAAGTQ